jgi:hypothetical protein
MVMHSNKAVWLGHEIMHSKEMHCNKSTENKS